MTEQIIIILIEVLVFYISDNIINGKYEKYFLNKTIDNLEKYIHLRCKNILLFAKNMKSIMKRFNQEYYNTDYHYINKGKQFSSFYDLAEKAHNRSYSKTLNNLMYNCFIDDIDNIIQDLLVSYSYDKKQFLKDLCWEFGYIYRESLTLKKILDAHIKDSKYSIGVHKCNFMKDIIGLINYNSYFRYENIKYEEIRQDYNSIITYIFFKYNNFITFNDFKYQFRLKHSKFFLRKIKKFIK